jgi:multiple sugar transport system substrate-binding protein
VIKANWRTLLLAVVALSVLVAACEAGVPAGRKKADNEITVWYFDKVPMATAIPLFEKAHPGVKVNFVHQPFGDMGKKYLAALAAKKDVPDVIGLDTSMVGRFLPAGENLLAEPYDAGQFRADFVEWKFNAPIQPSGEMSAFPWDVATGVMFYRPDIFKEAGLPTEPEEVARALATWDDFIRAGQQIKAKTNGRSAIIGSEHDLFNVAFWQTGGNIVSDGEITFLKDAEQPLELSLKAKEAGIGANVVTWSERWPPALQSGRVATVIMGAWMLGNLQSFVDKEGAGNWRVTTAPGGAFNNGGTYLQIPKWARNKGLAWEFVKFLTTNADTQNAVFQKTGIAPAYKPAWNSPIYDEPVSYLGGQRAWRLMVKLAREVKPLRYSPMDALGADLLNSQVDATLGGKVEPKQALLDAATQVQERAQRASNLKLELPVGAA